MKWGAAFQIHSLPKGKRALADRIPVHKTFFENFRQVSFFQMAPGRPNDDSRHEVRLSSVLLLLLAKKVRTRKRHVYRRDLIERRRPLIRQAANFATNPNSAALSRGNLFSQI